MITLALDVLAFLFLATVALVALGALALLPRRAWKVMGIATGAIAMAILYDTAPGFLAAIAGLAAMFALAALICLGLDRLRRSRLWKQWTGDPVNPDHSKL